MLEIRSASPSDHAPVADLVRSAGLPLAGLSEALRTAVVARDGEHVVGCAALELYGGDALLRSVVVAAERRGQRMGELLTEAALELARARGVRRVYLLTETAEGFFPRFGFRRITRTEVAAAVRESVEFRSACPDSAVVMVRET